MRHILLSGWLALLLGCQPQDKQQAAALQPAAFASPEVAYGQLFEAVQVGRVFPDAKTFADCIPLAPPDSIRARYERERGLPDFDLGAFVRRNFREPISYASGFLADPSRSAEAHIEALWPFLRRDADTPQAGSRIPLPFPYIVPGGRFGEIYYWDSYFTCLGLQHSPGGSELIRHMADNFAWMIDTLGFIPNGSRSYYLSRSQPPFFAYMVELLVEREGPSAWGRYLPALEKEYAFWMEGWDRLSPEHPAEGHVVRLPGGELLNRYWDRAATPRAESYREDLALAQAAGGDPQQLYRDLRAACESGWDFSSRWFRDGQQLASIQTTSLIPPDLNALIYHLELALAEAWQLQQNEAKVQFYRQRALARRAALDRYCWDERLGLYQDYDWQAGRHTGRLSLATFYPLFAGMADSAQAARVAEAAPPRFLHPGGLACTELRSGQQWDAPNGWAPLQWIAIRGLRQYGHHALAADIRQRWVQRNLSVYRTTGKFVEKYQVEAEESGGGGGEYPLQDGFGWTNGVLLHLLKEG